MKKDFIPKEKIKYLDCRIVQRAQRYGEPESFYSLYIITQDFSILSETELETGLCYQYKILVEFLIDKFNDYLN